MVTVAELTRHLARCNALGAIPNNEVAPAPPSPIHRTARLTQAQLDDIDALSDIPPQAAGEEEAAKEAIRQAVRKTRRSLSIHAQDDEGGCLSAIQLGLESLANLPILFRQSVNDDESEVSDTSHRASQRSGVSLVDSVSGVVSVSSE